MSKYISQDYTGIIGKYEGSGYINGYEIKDRSVDSDRVNQFHELGKLKGYKNILIGTIGASHFLINMAKQPARVLTKVNKYESYNNKNFIWIQGGIKRHRPRLTQLVIFGGGGYLIHLPTNSHIKVDKPPKNNGMGAFSIGNKVIVWNGTHFEKIKKSEDKSESKIRYEEEESFSGKLKTKKPVTDMRELDHIKWELYIDEVAKQVPYIQTKEEAKKWLSGEENYGPPSLDMREALERHLDEDEFEKIKEELN